MVRLTSNTKNAMRDLAEQFSAGQALTSKEIADTFELHGLARITGVEAVYSFGGGRFLDETGVRVSGTRYKGVIIYYPADHSADLAVDESRVQRMREIDERRKGRKRGRE